MREGKQVNNVDKAHKVMPYQASEIIFLTSISLMLELTCYHFIIILDVQINSEPYFVFSLTQYEIRS